MAPLDELPGDGLGGFRLEPLTGLVDFYDHAGVDEAGGAVSVARSC